MGESGKRMGSYQGMASAVPNEISRLGAASWEV